MRQEPSVFFKQTLQNKHRLILTSVIVGFFTNATLANAIAEIENENFLEEDIHPIQIEEHSEFIAYINRDSTSSENSKSKETEIDNKKLSTKEHVQEFFSETPAMINVAQCESNFRHFNESGSVLKGNINSSDIGVMQINETYHGKKAEELGIDIYTKEGNMEYAMYLYENEGLTPWSASEHCWKESNHEVAKR
ncbi:MAG: hypothetical protein ACQESA_01130 [Patescibacteria group bacterium]